MSSSRNNLLRVLGLIFGVAVVIGGMVGQGVLRTPGIVANAVHSPALILLLWIVGALLVAISAFAYVELGSALPSAGGPYDFVHRAAGPLAGIIAGWGLWFVLVAIVVADFLHRLGVWPDVSSSGIAVAVLALFWLVNWTGTRISGGSQVGFSAFKGAALIALVILLFAQPATQQSASAGNAIGITGFAVALMMDGRMSFCLEKRWKDLNGRSRARWQQGS